MKYLTIRQKGLQWEPNVPPPYACLVVDYKEETKLFPIKLQKFFSAEKNSNY